jgi:hypothetical protein
MDLKLTTQSEERALPAEAECDRAIPAKASTPTASRASRFKQPDQVRVHVLRGIGGGRHLA